MRPLIDRRIHDFRLCIDLFSAGCPARGGHAAPLPVHRLSVFPARWAPCSPIPFGRVFCCSQKSVSGGHRADVLRSRLSLSCARIQLRALPDAPHVRAAFPIQRRLLPVCACMRAVQRYSLAHARRIRQFTTTIWTNHESSSSFKDKTCAFRPLHLLERFIIRITGKFALTDARRPAPQWR